MGVSLGWKQGRAVGGAAGRRTRAPGRSIRRSAGSSGDWPAYFTMSAASRKSASRTERSGENARAAACPAENSSGRLFVRLDARGLFNVPADDSCQSQVELLNRVRGPEVLAEQRRRAPRGRFPLGSGGAARRPAAFVGAARPRPPPRATEQPVQSPTRSTPIHSGAAREGASVRGRPDPGSSPR